MEIAKPTHLFLRNCGDFSAAIDEYNAVFEKIPNGKFLAVFHSDRYGDQFLPDGYHLSKIGHRNIAEKLIKQVADDACV